jgi:hypothetical protein
MRLPADTSAISFLYVMSAEPRRRDASRRCLDPEGAACQSDNR